MSRDKRTIYSELLDEIRRSQNATARFDRAVAARIGLNLTDMSCLDELDRAGPMPVGQLAARTGLSSGAMTAAIDRLERAGYVRRRRDPDDRRVVMIEPTEHAQTLDRFYMGHLELSQRLYRELTADQMELILRFTRAGREFNERRSAEVEAEAETNADGVAGD